MAEISSLLPTVVETTHHRHYIPPAPLSSGDTAAQTAAGSQGAWEEAI